MIMPSLYNMFPADDVVIKIHIHYHWYHKNLSAAKALTSDEEIFWGRKGYDAVACFVVVVYLSFSLLKQDLLCPLQIQTTIAEKNEDGIFSFSYQTKTMVSSPTIPFR